MAKHDDMRMTYTTLDGRAVIAVEQWNGFNNWEYLATTATEEDAERVMDIFDNHYDGAPDGGDKYEWAREAARQGLLLDAVYGVPGMMS